MRRVPVLLSSCLLPLLAAAAPAGIPPSVMERETCRQHVVEMPRVGPADLPRVPGEYESYVVIDYRLDGSGRAVDARVVEAQPRKRAFGTAALALLARTAFAPGAVEEHYTHVRTFSKVRRGSVESPM